MAALASEDVMRIALALFLFAHGIAHLVGFVGTFQLSPNVPFNPRVLGGAATADGLTLKAYGVSWLLLALGFAVVAAGALLGAPWWMPAAVEVTVISLVLCTLGWPEARIGFFLNVALLLLFAAVERVPLLAAVEVRRP
jgi:hypothetical protein